MATKKVRGPKNIILTSKVSWDQRIKRLLFAGKELNGKGQRKNHATSPIEDRIKERVKEFIKEEFFKDGLGSVDVSNYKIILHELKVVIALKRITMQRM